MDKAHQSFPALTAEKCSTWFPIKETTDTVTIHDLIEVECPPDTVTQIWVDEKRDTVVLTKVGKTKIVQIPAEKIYITKTVKDSTQATIYQSRIDGMKDDAVKTKIRHKVAVIIWQILAGLGWLVAIILFILGRLTKRL